MIALNGPRFALPLRMWLSTSNELIALHASCKLIFSFAPFYRKGKFRHTGSIVKMRQR